MAALVIAELSPIDFDVTASGLAALVFCALGCLGQLEHQARLLLQQHAADLRRRVLMHRVLEGTGLGLALVNAHLGLHQGQLTIESVLGRGTTVTMLFPAVRMLTELSTFADPNAAEATAAV